MNLHLKNVHIIDPVSGRDSVNDILIRDGVIETIGESIATTKGFEVVDRKNTVVAPGFLDMHVHLREPGFEHKETIETGTASAAAGGFTGVCCMPNTNPAIDDAAIVRQIIERARGVHAGLVDVFPVAAVTKGREGKQLAPMIELAEAGAVAFSDDGAPVGDAEIMRRALEYASMLKKPLIQHAEEVSMTRGGAMNEGFVSTLLGMQAMPPVAEDLMVQRDIALARYVTASYHVAHISTANAVELVRRAKKDGQAVTCEVTPHHFTLTDEAVRSFDTNTKMNPPLRTKEDVEAMKEGLRDGTIDVIATDHAPHSFDEKQVEYIYAPFGIVGLETALGLAIRELVVPKILSLHQLIEKFSVNPRRILGLRAVTIREGEKANITLFDPAIEWKVDVGSFKSKSRNSPFHEAVLLGRSIGVINNNAFQRTF